MHPLFYTLNILSSHFTDSSLLISLTLTRKEQIRQIAQNMFRERGYAATSMRDLATAVGIEAASLYNHIRSKEDILQQICFGMAEEFFTVLNEVKDLDINADEKLTRAIKGHILVITNNLDAAGVFLTEWRFLSEPHLKTFKDMRNRYEREFQRIVLEGIRQDIFKLTDIKLYCLSLFSAMNWIYQWYQPNGELSPEELGEKFSLMLLDGLRK